MAAQPVTVPLDTDALLRVVGIRRLYHFPTARAILLGAGDGRRASRPDLRGAADLAGDRPSLLGGGVRDAAEGAARPVAPPTVSAAQEESPVTVFKFTVVACWMGRISERALYDWKRGHRGRQPHYLPGPAEDAPASQHPGRLHPAAGGAGLFRAVRRPSADALCPGPAFHPD